MSSYARNIVIAVGSAAAVTAAWFALVFVFALTVPETYPAAANGCLYTNKATVAVYERLTDFYRCALWHDTHFVINEQLNFTTRVGWADFQACYWDFGTRPLAANADFQKVVALDALLDAALADPALRASERGQLAWAQRDVRLVRTLVESGHYLSAHSDFFMFGTYWEHPILIYFTGFALTQHGDAEPDYEARILHFIAAGHRALDAWLLLMETAVNETGVFPPPPVIQLSAYEQIALYMDFSSLCRPTFANESACLAAGAAAEESAQAVAAYYADTFADAALAARPESAPGLWNVPNGSATYALWLRYHSTRGAALADPEAYAEGMWTWAVEALEDLATRFVAAATAIDPALTTLETAMAAYLNGSDARFYECRPFDDPFDAYLARAQASLDALQTLTRAQLYDAAPPPVNYTFGLFPYNAEFSLSGVFDGTRVPGTWTLAPQLKFRTSNYCNASFTNAYAALHTHAQAARIGEPGMGYQQKLAAQRQCVLESEDFQFLGLREQTVQWTTYMSNLTYSYAPPGDNVFTAAPHDALHHLAWMLQQVASVIADVGLHANYTDAPHLTLAECTALLETALPLNGYAAATCGTALAMPGAAAGFYEGAVGLPQLKARVQAALGERFNVREFHALVTRWGSWTRPHLEALLDTYVAWVQNPREVALNDMFGYADIVRAELRSAQPPMTGRGRKVVV